ncbi:MAG: VOC family protein [Pseudomonadota bacterium]
MSFSQGNPVVWFEIYVQDMERAKTFYEAVFAIKLEPMHPLEGWPNMEMWAFPSDKEKSQTTYGACGMLIQMEGVPSGGGGTLIYFGCEDCAVEAKRAVEHGGTLFKEKMSIGENGFIAMVQDTEGNMIGLHNM